MLVGLTCPLVRQHHTESDMVLNASVLLLPAAVQEQADNKAADASKVSVRHGEQGVSVPPGSVAAG
jgi:hypothetical protein